MYKRECCLQITFTFILFLGEKTVLKLEEKEEEKKMGLFVFPGHKYLGPGNKLNCGEPVDSDDAIAREHDHDYETASCKEDVYFADTKAIFLFILDWFKNKNWHSAVGAIGLSFKHGTEILLRRVLYPRFKNKK